MYVSVTSNFVIISTGHCAILEVQCECVAVQLRRKVGGYFQDVSLLFF